MRHANLFGYWIAADSLKALVAELVADLSSSAKPPHFLVAMNPVKVIYADRHPELREALGRATVLYPDGYGICWAIRMLEGLRITRVPGVDLAQALLSEAERNGRAVYLLGASPEIHLAAVEAVRQRHPRLRIAGSHHGYFRNGAEESGIVNAVRRSGAEVLLVALGSPQQEIWIDRNLSRLGVRLAMGVGGTFDVLAGAVQRAPAVVQKLGLEWAWRAVLQPAKIRRVMATRPHFIWKTIREIGRRPSNKDGSRAARS